VSIEQQPKLWFDPFSAVSKAVRQVATRRDEELNRLKQPLLERLKEGEDENEV
jgi:hypothetical protein